jgi:hypothetical protein
MEEKYEMSYAEMSARHMSDDPCSQRELLVSDIRGTKNRSYYQEMFRIDVCNYLDFITDLVNPTRADKEWLVQPLTLDRIPNIQYKNVKLYTLGYFLTKNTKQYIDEAMFKKIRLNLTRLRLEKAEVDPASLIRYTRFWIQKLFV